MSEWNDDQKLALRLAINVIATGIDEGYTRDEQDQNLLDLMDRYADTYKDANERLWGGTASLAQILLRKLAAETETDPELVLRNIASEYGATE